MPCLAHHLIVVQSDAYGHEVVSTLTYYACGDDAVPPDRRAMPVCRVGKNPYAEMIWARPLDAPNVEWLCAVPEEK